MSMTPLHLNPRFQGHDGALLCTVNYISTVDEYSGTPFTVSHCHKTAWAFLFHSLKQTKYTIKK
jgi:hypothetical protein